MDYVDKLLGNMYGGTPVPKYNFIPKWISDAVRGTSSMFSPINGVSHPIVNQAVQPIAPVEPVFTPASKVEVHKQNPDGTTSKTVTIKHDIKSTNPVSGVLTTPVVAPQTGNIDKNAIMQQLQFTPQEVPQPTHGVLDWLLKPVSEYQGQIHVSPITQLMQGLAAVDNPALASQISSETKMGIDKLMLDEKRRQEIADTNAKNKLTVDQFNADTGNKWTVEQFKEAQANLRTAANNATSRSNVMQQIRSRLTAGGLTPAQASVIVAGIRAKSIKDKTSVDSMVSLERNINNVIAQLKLKGKAAENMRKLMRESAMQLDQSNYSFSDYSNNDAQ